MNWLERCMRFKGDMLILQQQVTEGQAITLKENQSG